MLALKLLVVPLFLGLISLAGRRWGPAVAGRLAGFPVIAGPVLVFLTIEHGAEFAARAAGASLAAITGTVAFNVAYARACLRAAWPLALLAALAAWTAGVLLGNLLPPSPPVLGAAALAVLLLGPWLFPTRGVSTQRNTLPRSELVLRMAAGALLTFAVTAVAADVGPAWTGLLALLPVLGTVLSVFSHRASGPAYTVALLDSMITGLYALAAFCFAASLLLPRYPAVPAFTAAIAFAVAVQWAASRLPESLRPQAAERPPG